MPAPNKSGLRIAAAAATALALAAGSPAFAQDTESGFSAWLDTVQLLDQQYNEVEANLEVPESAADGSVTELEVVFTPSDHDTLYFHAPEGPVDCEDDWDEQDGPRDGVMNCRFNDESGITEFPEAWPIVAVVHGATAESDGSFTIEIFVNGAETPVFSSTGEYDLADAYDGDDGFTFAYRNHTLQGADVGETVTAAPQIKVDGTAAVDRAGSVVRFVDAVDEDSWSWADDRWDSAGMDADIASAVDSYDNCAHEGIWLVCVVTEWSPEAGVTYAPSESSPIRYAIEGEVEDHYMGVYSVWDVNRMELDRILESFDIDLEGDTNFSLTAVDADDIAPEEDFTDRSEGWIRFEEPVGEGDLPETGSSMAVIITSALGAVAIGAVVFFVLRRRNTAENWG
ncbi:LPXTG cell wall anchor domain-containing protein [Glycomyces salinus]|uniref:LPXTG cell wall anchor domain-containing protein n=1 Tax=Glycomyces salinus TaxID=980294 RepID=UPI0018EBD59C|nr:LPXTG cell wall anchor domain-containing protein [Glycomyces salinus]